MSKGEKWLLDYSKVLFPIRLVTVNALYVLWKASYFVAVAFANIFMSRIETEIISKSKTKLLEWKRCIDDVFSLWEKGRETINQFVLEVNTHHPTIKFTAEISEKEIPFLDTTIFKGERFYEDAILDICTHFKPT